MKKTIFTSEGRIFSGKHVTRLDGRIELNPSALSAEELHATCGLFTYEPTATKADEVAGQLVFNTKTGTCTHAPRKLTIGEIEEQANQNLFAEFEMEQEEEKRVKFEDWKAKKETKTELMT